MTNAEIIEGLKKIKNILGVSDSPKSVIYGAILALEGRKEGHWIKISPAGIYECSECGQNVMTSDICAYKFCHGCGLKMVEPQKSED